MFLVGNIGFDDIGGALTQGPEFVWQRDRIFILLLAIRKPLGSKSVCSDRSVLGAWFRRQRYTYTTRSFHRC